MRAMPGMAEPYKSTPLFTELTLPDALRRAHLTKAGVWGVLKVTRGSLLYVLEASGKQHRLDAPACIIIQPEELHHVEPLGAMEMQVDFYRTRPQA